MSKADQIMQKIAGLDKLKGLGVKALNAVEKNKWGGKVISSIKNTAGHIRDTHNLAMAVTDSKLQYPVNFSRAMDVNHTMGKILHRVEKFAPGTQKVFMDAAQSPMIGSAETAAAAHVGKTVIEKGVKATKEGITKGLDKLKGK